MEVHVCSPDKIDPFNKNNPRANRILNRIAISAISSFLKFPFNFHFVQLKICLYTEFCFFLFFFRTIWSLNLFLLIWTLYYINFILFSRIFFSQTEKINFSVNLCDVHFSTNTLNIYLWIYATHFSCFWTFQLIKQSTFIKYKFISALKFFLLFYSMPDHKQLTWVLFRAVPSSLSRIM